MKITNAPYYYITSIGYLLVFAISFVDSFGLQNDIISEGTPTEREERNFLHTIMSNKIAVRTGKLVKTVCCDGMIFAQYTDSTTDMLANEIFDKLLDHQMSIWSRLKLLVTSEHFLRGLTRSLLFSKSVMEREDSSRVLHPSEFFISRAFDREKNSRNSEFIIRMKFRGGFTTLLLEFFKSNLPPLSEPEVEVFKIMESQNIDLGDNWFVRYRKEHDWILCCDDEVMISNNRWSKSTLPYDDSSLKTNSGDIVCHAHDDASSRIPECLFRTSSDLYSLGLVLFEIYTPITYYFHHYQPMASNRGGNKWYEIRLPDTEGYYQMQYLATIIIIGPLLTIFKSASLPDHL